MDLQTNIRKFWDTHFIFIVFFCEKILLVQNLGKNGKFFFMCLKNIISQKSGQLEISQFLR